MLAAPELVERALAASRAAGCAVIVHETSEAVLRWANNTMTTNGHTTERRWSVVSLVRTPDGMAAGVVSSSSTADTAGAIEDVVAASEAAARHAGPARDAAALPAPESEPGPDDAGTGWDSDAAETSIAVFGRLAEELGDAFGQAAGGGRLLYGFAEHRLTTTWLGSSTGVRRRWVQPTGTVELNAKTADLTTSAWGGASTTDFADVDLSALVAELTGRLAWGARRVALTAGRYETLLPPSAVADLLIDLAASMGGRAAQEGRSAFSAPSGAGHLSGPGGTRVGERLSPLPLTLASDPAAPGLEYAPFVAYTRSDDEQSVFDNGAPARRVEWLRDGVVHELAYPRTAAAEFSAAGATFTPTGDNLLLTGGSSATLAELVAGTERGLLLTCLWYIREVDPTTLLLTGLTRDGVYLVEGGEVVGEVNNFRFNESPLDLLRRASEVGATQRTLPRECKDWFPRTAMPPMRVPDFNMSSVSQAS